MATKTFEELKQLAIQIRDEKTNKQNTATRVGTAMLEHINKLEQDYYDKTQTDEKLTELGKELNLTNKSISLIIGDIENLEYTESECINENMSLNNKGQLTPVTGVKASDFKNIENAIYLSYNIQNKGGNYVIAFYSDESEDSYLGQYSSTNLPSAGIDTDITKYIPNGAKYIRYTTYSNWVLRIKVVKSIPPSSGLLGNLSELKTEEKESFVSAFNELYDKDEEYNNKIENTLNGGDYNQ